jgi:hypothetical protein
MELHEHSYCDLREPVNLNNDFIFQDQGRPNVPFWCLVFLEEVCESVTLASLPAEYSSSFPSHFILQDEVCGNI